MRIFVFSLLIFVCGCAAMMELLNEGRQVPKEEVLDSSAAISVLMGDAVPQPYRLPAAYALGWISALLRRLYKKKKGSLG